MWEHHAPIFSQKNLARVIPSSVGLNLAIGLSMSVEKCGSNLGVLGKKLPPLNTSILIPS